jgi:Salmonella virulence plasmid 65kDa B protein/Insecticide toxin TcdB middle/C-terminal region/Insecticide toxin TcdB middle/N-terminal region
VKIPGERTAPAPGGPGGQSPSLAGSPSFQDTPTTNGAASGLPGVAVAPTVTVPKGGGAVRGIGEKFTTNPATGTAGLSIPLPMSPGRSGFTPALALSYDSGAGQGLFGLGWGLGLPSISRKTDKGVPTYDGQDVFILSGAEDLVPVRSDGRSDPPRTVGTHTFSVRRYRWYLADRAAGARWVTRLPFPVHVVDKVETDDHVNQTRLVSRCRYHHGRFDGAEREFCGFAMVEQEDSEQLAALVRSETLPVGGNVDAAGQMPPVLTRSWFHTGAYLDRQEISTYLAQGYYPPPEQAIPEALAWRLDDSVLDGVTTLEGEHEACRALKGRPLRQEVYALDGTPAQPHPYSVVEHNYTVRQLQPAGPKKQSAGRPTAERHGVFAVDPRETVTATCERDPTHARVAHEVVLDVDPWAAMASMVEVLPWAFGRIRHGVWPRGGLQ